MHCTVMVRLVHLGPRIRRFLLERAVLSQTWTRKFRNVLRRTFADGWSTVSLGGRDIKQTRKETERSTMMARKHTERSYLELSRDGQPYLHNLHSEDGLMEKLNAHNFGMHILPKAQKTTPCLSTAASELLESSCLSFFMPGTLRHFQPQCTPKQSSDSGARSWQRRASFGKAGPVLTALAPCSRMPARNGAKVSLKARPEPIEWRSAPQGRAD